MQKAKNYAYQTSILAAFLLSTYFRRTAVLHVS